VTAFGRQSETHLRPADSTASHDAFILHCQHCDWSSLDTGIKFNKPTKITEQLNKLWKARHTPPEENPLDGSSQVEPVKMDHDTAFKNLMTFYKEQLQEAGDAHNPYGNSPYNSPANLQRIMNLYGGLSYNALKKTREKPQPMREAKDRGEGMVTYVADEDTTDEVALQKLQQLGINATATASQRLATPANFDARFTDDLWPVATPLRVRRGKRCRTCRQFLARPEPKVGSMRYKIRLIAVNFIQRLSVRPLQAAPLMQNTAFHVRADPLPAIRLQPHQAKQYILTVRNPIFESVKITLGTPAITPGRVASRVTILCPSFTVGPAGDMWDEALSASTTSTSDGGRQAAMASLTGSSEADRQPEAGKIWERSRNSTSVILEVVPGSLQQWPSIVPKGDSEVKEEQIRKDDDLLEIPIYVRAEWEADAHEDEGLSAGGKKKERENKELGYWCVIGLGRIAEG
jgi:dynactin-4